jgi:hypothetical protein
MCCWCEDFLKRFIYLIFYVIVGDWDEAECFYDFSDFVVGFDSLNLLSEWIHFVWLSLVLQVAEFSGFFVQSGLLFVAGLLSVPGFRHVGAQDLY